MAKKFWVVLDGDMDSRTQRGIDGVTRRQFVTRDEAAEFARELVRDNERDYYLAEVVAIATSPKAPVEVIDLAA